MLKAKLAKLRRELITPKSQVKKSDNVPDPDLNVSGF
jgi:ribosome-interacting GTPase 1